MARLCPFCGRESEWGVEALWEYPDLELFDDDDDYECGYDAAVLRALGRVEEAAQAAERQEELAVERMRRLTKAQRRSQRLAKRA